MVSSEDITKHTVRILNEAFLKYFSKAQKETKHIILDRFFPEQRRVTSTMSGLQTSLGTYWEKLSIELASKNGFSVINNSELMRPSSVPANLSDLTNKVKREREDAGGELTGLKDELNILYPVKPVVTAGFKSMTKGKGADVILGKGGKIYLFDIKTVQVNANSGNSFNETLILWTAYYKYKFGIDAKNIYARLAFPYNSANELDDDAWWNNFGGRVSPLTKQDAFVGNEYWSFLTGNVNALTAIVKGFNQLANNTAFITLYNQAFECGNYDGLVRFSERVRLDKIQKKYSVELTLHESPMNLRKKFKWKHGEDGCEFKEKLNKLLNSESYTCPVCDNEL